MILSRDAIEAMIEALSRMRRAPEREWLTPVIEELSLMRPGWRVVLRMADEDDPLP
jgi:hypothetical protein